MRLPIAALLLIGIVSVAAAQEDPRPRVTAAVAKLLKPKKLPGSSYEVWAGKIEVWENHSTKGGRRIPLNVIVVPAKNRKDDKSPLFPLAGGPGNAATASVSEWLSDLELSYCLYEDRDVVLVDQRGTGESNALVVSAAATKDIPLQAFLSPTDRPAEDVTAFRRELEKHADLTQYGTPQFVQDLEEVRRQLGYDKIDLWGISYGTRPAQEYIRRYPDRVRCVVMLGSMPLEKTYLTERSLYTQRAIERLIDDCAKNEACSAAFPEIRREFEELLTRLKKEPAKVNFKHPERDVAEEVQITRETFTEKLRLTQSSNQGMRMLPYVIHHAYGQDYEPFLKLAIPPKLKAVDPQLGVYLCIVFTDDIPFLVAGDWERLSPQTYMGNNLVKLAGQYRTVWPKGDAPTDFQDSVISGAPALLITGRLDSLTPVEGGDTLSRRFKNSKHVVVPQMSHVPFDLPNLQDDFLRVLDDFFDRGSVDGLDTTRLSRLKAPPYVTSDLEFRVKMLFSGR